MEKTIPLTLERLSDEAQEQLRINSVREIESILQYIQKHHTRVALYYDKAGTFAVTTIVGIDKQTIYLDQSPQVDENELIEKSTQLMFVSTHNKVKVQVPLKSAKRVTYQNYPSLEVPFPTTLYRIQRREFFRVHTNEALPVQCNIIRSIPATNNDKNKLTVLDISGGGLSLSCTETELKLVPNQTYQCQIDLPNIGKVLVHIEVKNVIRKTAADNSHYWYAGCEFQKLDRQSTLLLQRYINELERNS